MVALTLIGGEGSDLDLISALCWELGCVGIEELDDSIRATFADRAAAVTASTRLADFVRSSISTFAIQASAYLFGNFRFMFLCSGIVGRSVRAERNSGP